MSAFEQDARAIVRAAAIAEGEDSDAVMAGRLRSRARVYAFIALAHRYPRQDQTSVMLACGAAPEQAFDMAVTAIQATRDNLTKRRRWFDLDRLNEILAAVGWQPMIRTQSEVRRRPVQSRIATRTAITLCIVGLMGELEAVRAELARAGAGAR